MDIPEITKKYRESRGMTLQGFADWLTESIPHEYSRQTVLNWESGNARPSKFFLLLVLLKYIDDRKDWALDCLAVIEPELYAVEDATNA